jgi:cell division protein FtsQ
MSTTGTAAPPAERRLPGRPRDRRRLIVLGVAGAVLLALVGTWIVAFSSVFGVRSVQVRGNHVLTVAQIRQAAAIKGGTPLVRLDTGAVTRRVEQLPDVASAQVSTSFPSTVVITIEERLPVGYVRRDGQAVLVDRTGDQYRAVAAPPAGLPRFVIGAGSQARATGAAIAAVAAALPRSIARQVRSIDALNPSSITLVLSRGRVVQWGSADRTADKARLLPVLLRHHVEQVNLTNPDQPYTN